MKYLFTMLVIPLAACNPQPQVQYVPTQPTISSGAPQSAPQYVQQQPPVIINQSPAGGGMGGTEGALLGGLGGFMLGHAIGNRGVGNGGGGSSQSNHTVINKTIVQHNYAPRSYQPRSMGSYRRR